MIVVSIDLTKIDKTKIKEHTNGSKYYSFVVDANKEPDKFGNTHCLYESQTKEQRAAKEKKKFIGSGKEYVFAKKEQQQAAPVQSSSYNPAPETIDDLPF